MEQSECIYSANPTFANLTLRTNIGENFHPSRGPTPRTADVDTSTIKRKSHSFVFALFFLSSFVRFFFLSFSTIVDVRAGTCIA